jgi:hypothetical protein
MTSNQSKVLSESAPPISTSSQPPRLIAEIKRLRDELDRTTS